MRRSLSRLSLDSRLLIGILLFISLLPIVPAFASTALEAGRAERGAVSGIVVDHDGQPVSDASVVLAELRSVELTDAAGSFTFTGLVPGHYHLRISSPSRGSAALSIDIEPNQTLELGIEVHLSVHREEIVVTAGPGLRVSSEVVQPVAVLTGDELLAALQPTLGETLDDTPGVSSTYFGPGASRPIIRGLGSERSRVLVVGLDVGDASGVSPDHALSLDPLGAERVEIVRGPATLLYGSGAIGGVVNVLDASIPVRLPKRALEGELTLGYGDAAEERLAQLEAGGGAGAWAWRVHGSRRDAGDIEIPGPAEAEHEPGEEEEEEPFTGKLENSAAETEAVGFGLSRVWENGYVGFSVQRFDSDYGVPGEHGHGHEEEPELAEEHEEGVRIDLEQKRADLGAQFELAEGFLRTIDVRVGVTDYTHSELEGDEVGTLFNSDGWELRAEGTHRPWNSWTGAFGVQLSSNELEAFGEEAFLAPSDTDSQALFVFEERGFGAWDLQLGARYERQEVRGSFEGRRVDRDFDNVSTSLGLSRRFGGNYGLSLHVSRAVRSPNAEELTSNGLHAATRSFEIGDPNLDEETSLGADLTLRKKDGRFSGALTVFLHRIDDFIYEAPTGEEIEETPVFRFVQDDAEYRGAEFHIDTELVHRAGHRLAFELGGDLVRAERRHDDEPLPFIPARTLRAGLRYRGERLFGHMEAVRTNSQRRVFCPHEEEPGHGHVAGCEEPSEGYTFVNAAVGMRFAAGGVSHSVMLKGRNLGDRLARSHVSRLREFAPLPGRDLVLLYTVSY